jgi:hypothetical protein
LTPSAKTITTTHTIVETAPSSGSFRAAWRWWLPPAIVALLLAVFFIDPFIGDWDGLDYTILSLRGEPSSMALGRTLFIFANHIIWRIAVALFHLPPEQAYLVFKYVVVAQCPLAVIACWTLARDLTASKAAATLAAVLVAASPIFVIYSGQVMTDVPSLLLVAVALIIHLRGLKSRRIWLVLAGAVLLGAGVNMRETVAFYAPWLAFAPLVYGWKLRGKDLMWTLAACVIFLILALAPWAFLYASDVNNYRAAWQGWRETMNQEVARHPVQIRNVGPFMLFFFALSPMTLVALPVAAWKEWRENGLSPLLLMAVVGFFANVLLIFNYSTAINWRYVLTGFPAIVPLVASYFLKEQTAKWRSSTRAFWAVIAGIAFTAIVCGFYLRPISAEHILKRSETKNYRARLMLVPDDAVIIAGGQTIAVNYWRGIGTGHWDTIGTGSGWPGDKLDAVIEAYLQSGRRVFLDADLRWWSLCGWQREETTALLSLEPRFRFRRVGDMLFEIRPLSDETARDQPELHRLLPENRPVEVAKCPR